MFTRDKGAETISQRRKVPMDGTQRPCQSDSVSFAVIYSIPPIRYRRWLQVCQRIRPVSKTNRSHVYQQFKAAGRDCRRGIETWSGNSVESPRQVSWSLYQWNSTPNTRVLQELVSFEDTGEYLLLCKKIRTSYVYTSSFQLFVPLSLRTSQSMHLFRYEFFEVLFLLADRISVFTSIDNLSIRELSRCDFHFFAARGAVSAVNLIRMRGWCYSQCFNNMARDRVFCLF